MVHQAQVVWTVAGVCSALATVTSAFLIRKHQENFTRPVVQAKIVGILWMVPIYAVDSWLSLRFKEAALYLNLLRDCYEGYALYLFLALLVGYLGNGDEYKVVSILEQCPEKEHSWPFTWVFKGQKVPHGQDFLTWAKFGTLQYSVVKPSMTFVAIMLAPWGIYKEGNFSPWGAWVWITGILNLSIAYAFYCLVNFYVMLKSPLQPYRPVPKFLCIKAVLFLSYWQSVILAILVRVGWIHAMGEWSTDDVATGIQDTIICVEMLAVALAHTYAFPYEPYMGGVLQRTGTFWEDHFAHDSAIRDFNEVMPVLLPGNFTPGPATSIIRIPVGERENDLLVGPYVAAGAGADRLVRQGSGTRPGAAAHRKSYAVMINGRVVGEEAGLDPLRRSLLVDAASVEDYYSIDGANPQDEEGGFRAPDR